MKRINQREVARRRIIERLEISGGKGVIVAGGTTFLLDFDDVLDLAQTVELIQAKLTGKMLRAKLRPAITNRSALEKARIVGGDYTLYDGQVGAAPVEPMTKCDVTGQDVKAHYVLVEIQGNRWDNWIGRLDELIKCLYIVIREAQVDPYMPALQVFAQRPGAQATVH